MLMSCRSCFNFGACLVVVLVPMAASAQGTIEGTVIFWGDPGTGTEVEVAAHSNPNGPPDANTFVSLPGGPYSIPVADGTYYVAVLMAPDGVFGEPRPVERPSTSRTASCGTTRPPTR